MMYYVLCSKENISASSARVLIVVIKSVSETYDMILYTKLNRLVVVVSFRWDDVNRPLCLLLHHRVMSVVGIDYCCICFMLQQYGVSWC